MDVFLSALILPFLMVLLLAKVTYSRVVAVSLTVILIMTSAFLGYTTGFLLILLDAFSITMGLVVVNLIKHKRAKAEHDEQC
nr:DUF2198 family protein [Brochothrix campestris]